MPSSGARQRSTTGRCRCSVSSPRPGERRPRWWRTCAPCPPPTFARSSTSCAGGRCWCPMARSSGSATNWRGRCSTTSCCPVSAPTPMPGWRPASSATVPTGSERSPATGRPPMTHHEPWPRRSPPAARPSPSGPPPKPRATSSGRWNCGARSTTRWPVPGSTTPRCSPRRPLPPRYARHVERAIALDLGAAAELAGVDAMREARVWLHLRGLYRFGQRWDECAAAVQRALALIPATAADHDARRGARRLGDGPAATPAASPRPSPRPTAPWPSPRSSASPEALIRAHYALVFGDGRVRWGRSGAPCAGRGERRQMRPGHVRRADAHGAQHVDALAGRSRALRGDHPGGPTRRRVGPEQRIGRALGGVHGDLLVAVPDPAGALGGGRASGRRPRRSHGRSERGGDPGLQLGDDPDPPGTAGRSPTPGRGHPSDVGANGVGRGSRLASSARSSCSTPPRVGRPRQWTSSSGSSSGAATTSCCGRRSWPPASRCSPTTSPRQGAGGPPGQGWTPSSWPTAGSPSSTSSTVVPCHQPSPRWSIVIVPGPSTPA